MATDAVNPIIPGFAPDPSLVKVDGWYYLVNSTFHMFPGLPIYASRDLVSWTHICNAIHRRNQLSLAKSDTKFGPHSDEVMLATGGLYAPTIRYHQGTFYVVCTNIIHPGGDDVSENFIVTTKDIWEGVWSDPIYFDFKGIDPSILFDDGKTYIQGSAAPGPFTKINLFEIDLSTGKKLSDERTIWGGTGGIYPEGPHLYKRNGWYYLMISEGGTHEGHMITMARSRDVWGPYDPCPNNPILTARDTDEYIQYTGHCEAFQDESGQWWGVCLGVRKDEGGRFIMGRETFLTRGNWDCEWLSFETVKSYIPNLPPKDGSSVISAAVGIDYLYIRDVNLTNYVTTTNNSSITLATSPVDLSHPETSPTFIGRRQRKLHGQSSVTLRSFAESWQSSKLRSGIACYKDEHRYVRIFYDATDSAVVFELVNKAKQLTQMKRHSLVDIPEQLSLRMEYTEKEYRLSFKVEGGSDENWTCIALTDTINLTGPDFVGPVIGIFAVAETSGLMVELNDFQVD
ncbi:glycosyl hydrolase [Dactylonectria macrodidyma]|uniref:Glycosyl hydrolase n=1 Tax=Dactylonectria macrodidyma TaxID=307937 RepID=A0A9P9F9G3_9HYPO|nr:glycosyl hydrolase [Dactylonectria macrodidyma]